MEENNIMYCTYSMVLFVPATKTTIWVRVVFSVPLPFPLLHRVVDFGTGEECGVERLTLYIFLYSNHTIRCQSLCSNIFFFLTKYTRSRT